MKNRIALSALLIAIGVLSYPAKSQSINLENSIILIVEKISHANTYEITSTIGYTGAISKQYLYFKKLVRYGEYEELIHFANNHPNAVVRLYAYQALKLKKLLVPQELREKFENDNSTIQVINGCNRYEKNVNSLLQQPLFI